MKNIPFHIYAGLDFCGSKQTVKPIPEKQMIRKLRADYNFFLDAKEKLIDKSLTARYTPEEHAQVRHELAMLTSTLKRLDNEINHLAARQPMDRTYNQQPGFNYARLEIRKIEKRHIEDVNWYRGKLSAAHGRNAKLVLRMDKLYSEISKLKRKQHEPTV